MSELRETLGHVVADRQTFSGDTATNQTNGREFTVEVEDVADIELNTALGRDARESVIIHTQDREAAEELVLGTRISVIGSLFKVLRREDNPAKLQVEFGLMKIVPGKDS